MRNVLAALSMIPAIALADEEFEPEPEPDVIIEREPAPTTPFDRGKMNLSIAGGTTSNFDKRYFAIGAGFGYYVLDGVELGISAAYQFGDGPSITNVRPRITYVAQPLVGTFPVIPYVGAFYNHWFIGDDVPDVDTIGGRVGAIYISGRVLLGLGVAVERFVSECTDECWNVYPDISISVSF